MIAGMYAEESIYDFKIVAALQKMKENGTKFIFCGIGGLEYNETEKNFVKFLDLIKLEILITRDRKTYEQYKDYVNYKQENRVYLLDGECSGDTRHLIRRDGQAIIISMV